MSERVVANTSCRDLKRMIDSTKMLCTKAQGTRPWTDYIILEFHKDGNILEAFSCNGSALSHQECQCSDIYEDFRAMILPDVVFPDKDIMVSICIEKEYLVFHFCDKVLKIAQSNSILNVLPDFHTIIDTNSPSPKDSIEVRLDADLLAKALSSQRKRFKSRRLRHELIISVSMNSYKPLAVIDDSRTSFVLVMPLRKNSHGETI